MASININIYGGQSYGVQLFKEKRKILVTFRKLDGRLKLSRKTGDSPLKRESWHVGTVVI